jgi:hypothetical protein
MALINDAEKAKDIETGTMKTESTAYLSDTDRAERKEEGAIGEPDYDHEEVEAMDRGHVDDLERQHVSYPLNHLTFEY